MHVKGGRVANFSAASHAHLITLDVGGSINVRDIFVREREPPVCARCYPRECEDSTVVLCKVDRFREGGV